MTGTFINVGTILLGTLIGSLLGHRLPEGLQHRVLAGLGLSRSSSASTMRWPGATPTPST